MANPVTLRNRTNFTGSFTDNLFSNDPFLCGKNDNLVLDNNEKMVLRPGSAVTYTDNPAPLGDTTRMSRLLKFSDDSTLMGVTATKLWYKTATSFTQITGATAALPSGVAASKVSYSEWKGHLFITDDQGSPVVKVYNDGSWRVRTAGLPAMGATAIFTGSVPADWTTLANDIRTQMLAHMNNTTMHPGGVDAARTALAATSALSSPTLAQLIAQIKIMVTAYQLHIADATSATNLRAYHPVTLGKYPGVPNVPLSLTADPVTLLDCALRLNELKRNFNWHHRSFRGHVTPLGSYVVSTASITHPTSSAYVLQDGPAYTAAAFTDQIAIANGLKAAFNSHIADLATGASYNNPHAHANLTRGGSFANLGADTESTVAAADATDLDTLFELTAHIYAGYRWHNDDAKLPVIFFLAGTWFDPTGAGITQAQLCPVRDGWRPTPWGMGDLTTGMYIWDSNGNTPNLGDDPTLTPGTDVINMWAKGTTVTAISKSATRTLVTLSANHNNKSAGALQLYNYFFSNMKWHMPSSAYRSADQIAALDVVDPSLVDAAANSPAALTTLLYDMVDKHNAHDGNDETFASIATNTTIHFYSPNFPYNNTVVDQPALANYEYAFVRHYTYTIGTTTFEDFGPPTTVLMKNVSPISDKPLSLSAIPSLANTASTNYDVANVTTRIYRSTNNGTTLYQVGELASGVTTFTDTVADTDLVTNALIYTSGGVLDNDPPPKAKYLHIVNNKAYYGGITDLSGNVLPRRVQESITNDPDSCPAASYADLDDDLMGISSSRSVPIAFCKRSFVRLENGFDELGRGALTFQVISDTVGCVSENSIVKTDQGVFFAGTDGFYFTDGYAYKKISNDWNTTYASLTSTAAKAAKINGTYDPQTRRIWWGAQAGATDADTCYILDLNYPLDPHPTWTTASGPTFTATALCFSAGTLYRGDSANYLYSHSASLKTDPYVTTGAATLWGTAPIVYDFQSCFEDFGAPDVRKWCTWLAWELERETNVNIQPQARNDKYDAWQDLSPFSYLSDWVWGDPLLVWGTPTYIWNSSRGIPGQKRRFPANQIRCSYKQIRFTNDSVLIKDSRDGDPDALVYTATTAAGAKTATLDDVDQAWIADPVGYYLSTSHDNYATSYRINRRSSASVLRVDDPDGTFPTAATVEWKITGTPKNQQFRMLEYAVLGAPQSRSQTAARPATAADV